MISLSLSEVATAVLGTLVGSDHKFIGVSTDTRSLSEGQLFVAIAGEHYDGHDMLEEAEEKGAIGVLVDRVVKGIEIPHIMVSDTRFALGSLARYWRKRFAVPVIGVTGSAGKTTVKNMLAVILKKLGPVLATPANLNNEIGLPLTLLGLSPEIRSVVLEMGAAKQGDIDYLARIAEPTVGVITMCSPAHLTGFGTIDIIAKTKGELISALPKNGTAILNSDDSYFDYWRTLVGSRKLLTFGRSGDIFSKQEDLSSDGSSFFLCSRERAREVSLKYLGRHNIDNALAASAAASTIGILKRDIAIALSDCPPTAGRLYPLRGKHRLHILDDTYNANPSALSAALEVLRIQSGHKWVVIGDMNELGELSKKFHYQAGKKMGEVGVDRLFTIGEKAEEVGKLFPGPVEHFADSELLVRRLIQISVKSEEDICLLVKGSRSMMLENVVDALSVSGGK